MALNKQELLQSYGMLHRVFPEDLHIARPYIQMLQHDLQNTQALNLALSMSRRMLASGNAAHAMSFLSLCRQLNHPDIEEIDGLSNMARYSLSNEEDNPEQTFALIEQLSDSEGLDFISQGSLIRVGDEERIVRQGENSRTFYLILDGHVDVRINVKKGKLKTVNALNPGDFFGECACVYKLPRSATIMATSAVLLLEFSEHSIAKLMQHSLVAGDYLIRTVQTRLVHAMTHGLPAFAELPEIDRLWTAEESTVDEFNLGESICGHEPAQPACHILLSGRAELNLADGSIEPLATGAMFGDISPYIRLPAEATLKATEHTLVCNIPENIFRSLMNAYASFDQQVKTLGTSPHQKYQSARIA